MLNPFPHTMTWYAKTSTPSVFTRTVVTEVMWQAQKVANTAKSGLVDSDKAIVYVPFVTADGTDRSATLTFKIGDYLVPEEVTDEMDADFPPTALIAAYPRTVQIRTVDWKDYGALKHVQIGGK